MIDSVSKLLARYAHINWALADQAVVSGVNFLTGLLVARYLGIDEFGRFTLVWLVILFAISIQDALISSPMMSLGPKQVAAEKAAYYGAVIVQQVLFSFASLLALFLAATLFFLVTGEWQLAGMAIPLAVTLFVCQFHDFFRRYFFSRGRVMTAFAFDGVRYIGQLIVLVWLYSSSQYAMDTGKTLWAIALATTASLFLASFCIGQVSVGRSSVREVAVMHWRSGKWLTASALLGWCMGNFFIVVVGALLGVAAVGALRASQNVMAVTNILFQGLQNIVPARASLQLHSGGPVALSGYIRKVALYGSALMLVVAMVVSIAPELWLEIIFGQEYSGYGYLLQGWAIIFVLIFLQLPLRSALRAFENTRPIFLSSVCTVTFSLLAAYPLIANLGLVGAIIGITMTQFILVMCLWFSLRAQLVVNRQ